MSILDEEDENLAHFLESEVLSEVSDQDEALTETEDSRAMRMRSKGGAVENEIEIINGSNLLKNEALNQGTCISSGKRGRRRIENGLLSKIPPELFHHILKFLSSEDLTKCSLVCKFLNSVASDECLWRRLYCMRWGLLPPKKLRECAWKKLYIERDEEDMNEFIRNCQPEFREYYIQMQVAKRSQAPLPSQVNDEQIILDKTVADQVSLWKSSRGLTDKVVTDHACSGETCSYYHIGNVFVCEKTGNVHVCDDTCREVILDPANELLVCTISGHCFDRLLLPAETESDAEQQQGGVTDEAEPFMGAGRFARAYLLGYNCADEKELEAALRFC
ncbi:hypothetical protein Nepgr_028520 [Nepenthes gracilis]|uniref:F-box domain-containing protein n=1 Tax=Nepenthes gracilis TaxID=150966 RepID=A0AAD3TC71_NEPGR|nr:hypothetical protein Nepgr_028520 [Nepenthes gracilis]